MATATEGRNINISIRDYLTSSGKFPNREKGVEAHIISNAAELLKKVNAFLNELGWHEPVVVSSGYRTPAANAAAGGAKKSAHMNGMAIDIADADGALGSFIRRDNGALLRKHGLFMESLPHTPTWVHLDYVDRKDRPGREFIP